MGSCRKSLRRALHSLFLLPQSTNMLARPVLRVACLLAGVAAWPNGAGLKSCMLGQPGGKELGDGWTTHGDHMVAEGRGPYRLSVKGLEVGGTYDPKGTYPMTLSSVNGTSIIHGFMVSPNVRHGTGRTFSGKVRACVNGEAGERGGRLGRWARGSTERTLMWGDRGRAAGGVG